MQKNRRDKFVTFLRESGADILKPTNEYEIVRFRTENCVSIMYRGKRGYSFTGEAKEAYERFDKKDIWQILRKDHRERKKLIDTIRERDGMACFFCGIETVSGETASIEHLLSIANGGNNNPANLTVACIRCNDTVGNMSIVQKIKYREANYQERLDHGKAET